MHLKMRLLVKHEFYWRSHNLWKKETEVAIHYDPVHQGHQCHITLSIAKTKATNQAILQEYIPSSMQPHTRKMILLYHS